MPEYMKVEGWTAKHLGLAVPEGKRVVYFVQGPSGFTESFDAHIVDLLCRMGLIRLDHEDDPHNGEHYHYKAFSATGRK